MTALELRTKTFAELNSLGFRPAISLPLPDVAQPIRAVAEVASRLMALDALFTWVAYDSEVVETSRIKGYLDRNSLRDWLTKSESEIVDLPRIVAYENHVDTIGWRLENMWPLAWVLGFEPEPDLVAAQISPEVTQPILLQFLPGLERTVDDLLEKAEPRSALDVIAMEYRFYCAHNAVRSAQLGGDTVPKGFHPVVHGGAIHERRHSLTWCINPDVSWDDIDLST